MRDDWIVRQHSHELEILIPVCFLNQSFVEGCALTAKRTLPVKRDHHRFAATRPVDVRIAVAVGILIIGKPGRFTGRFGENCSPEAHDWAKLD